MVPIALKDLITVLHKGTKSPMNDGDGYHVQNVDLWPSKPGGGRHFDQPHSPKEWLARA
jgi:hypothetical protein